MSSMNQDTNVNELLRSAIEEHNRGNLDAAKKAYVEVLNLAPDNFDALNLLGVIDYQRSDFQSAIERYQLAISINPESAEILTNYAAALKELGNIKDAINALRKAISFNSNFVFAHFNLANILLDIDKEQAIDEYRTVLHLSPENAEACKNLAWLLHSLDRQDEALAEIEKSIDLQPRDAEAFHVLGSVYRAMNRDEEAIRAYEMSLSIKPANVAIEHLLNALKGEDSEIAPAEYVRDLFDDFAQDFDTKLVDKLQYKTPSLMRELFDNVRHGDSYELCLDLGCGTGLSGLEFRDITKSITGIDISNGMIEKAREKDIYDYLEVTDLSEYLYKSEITYDLVLSADVLVYIGKLDELFMQISSHVEKSGFFIFSVELLDEGEYKIMKSGRYRHSHKYIRTLASNCGFEIITYKEANLRKESASWILGCSYIFQKI